MTAETVHTGPDADWMRLALEQARAAARSQEVPVGAVLVAGQELIAADHNRTVRNCDPTAHAEVLVLREGAARLGNYRLGDVTLYVTLEPCAMCAGALIWARVERLVFGAFDSKSGAVDSVSRLLQPGLSNHRVRWEGGLMESESQLLLREFFSTRRS